jgi:hypothetical protein
MQADLEKERLSLKMQSNILNNRAMTLMLVMELVQDQRTLIQQLLAHNDKVSAALNEKENSKRDGGAVSGAPQKAP